LKYLITETEKIKLYIDMDVKNDLFLKKFVLDKIVESIDKQDIENLDKVEAEIRDKSLTYAKELVPKFQKEKLELFNELFKFGIVKSIVEDYDIDMEGCSFYMFEEYVLGYYFMELILDDLNKIINNYISVTK
jgi:hypothetical protein